MHMNVFWDSNVVKEDIVKEWLSEVKAVALFYLGNEQDMAKL